MPHMLRSLRPPLVIAVVLSLAACGERAATRTATLDSAPPPGWTLVWSDEFDGPKGAFPDPATWAYDVGGGGWGNGELVQIIPAEISLEDTTRIWNALHRPFRPSLTYIARGVKIGIQPSPTGKPVVARRLSFTSEVPTE